MLIFIDEIQESPKAIQSLRYFKEEFPNLYVIAAGSLLEHALGDVESFPVGRVEYLTLHPVNFEEFLASANPLAAEAFSTLPVPEFAHQTLMDLFHQYAIVGGLPEVLSTFIEKKDFTALVPFYESLVQSFKDDVKKYAKNEAEARILRHIIETAPYEADSRIKLQSFGQSNYRSREVGEAMRSLELAGLVRLLYPTTAVSLPALPDLKKSPRLQLLDTGMMNYQAGLQKDLLGIQDLNQVFRGKIIQHLVTQEVISTHYLPSFKAMFWVRERSDAQAEVDLAYPHRSLLIPVEVKAGKDGKLRSLHQYMDRCDHPFAVRFHANYFVVEKVATPAGKDFYLMNLPYYLATRLDAYLDWFAVQYPD
ncbi:MAG: AAA family ATPase [Saprospiraceae bacterium]|nr:AAA family ATPase [Saprospiraceae bacterium]MCF8249453.1 AAA family ATPase [Saprospiraceae bacterium]MCF8279107.1 AAA family ATPase [Bacteroidales bacterium]MCF8440072.1 AAA family ATPase [Saprospiraceae bacterium]